MLDQAQDFEFEGRKLSLFFSYGALYALEKEHGLPLAKAYTAIVEDLSVVAQSAALLCGLEAHRKEWPDATGCKPENALRWTLADTQKIVMTLGPTHVAPLLADAFAKTCLPKTKKTNDAPDDPPGKQEAVTAGSTGTASS